MINWLYIFMFIKEFNGLFFIVFFKFNVKIVFKLFFINWNLLIFFKIKFFIYYFRYDIGSSEFLDKFLFLFLE